MKKENYTMKTGFLQWQFLLVDPCIEGFLQSEWTHTSRLSGDNGK